MTNVNSDLLPLNASVVVRIAQVNLNGLSSKLHSLSAFMKSNDLKVICVSETHLLEHISNSFVDIPGFRIYRSDSHGTTYKHGVCSYVHESILVDEFIAHKPNILSDRQTDIYLTYPQQTVAILSQLSETFINAHIGWRIGARSLTQHLDRHSLMTTVAVPLGAS